MDGITDEQLRIESLGEATLLHNHMYWISQCAKMDLWKDISDTFAYKRCEALGREIRIRRDAI